jgi:hypothetical protein
MNNNRYTETVESIHAPESTVKAALDSIRNHEKKEKTIRMISLRKAAIAAALAAVITLGAVLGINAFSTKSTPLFNITVNAAETTEKKFTPIGNLDVSGATYSPDRANGQLCLQEEFEAVIRVDGDGITDVAFGGEGYTLLERKEDDVQSGNGTYYLNIGITANSADSALPEAVRQAVRDCYDYINTKLGEPLLQPGFNAGTFDWSTSAKLIYDTLFSNLKITVNVSFDNGQTTVKTLVFTCDSVDSNGIVSISAKLQ